MSIENNPGDTMLVQLIARHNADLMKAQENIRTITRTLLARRVLTLEPSAVRLEVVPEEFEEGVRAHSAAVFNSEGTLLRSFEGDSEDPVDESVTELLEALTPEPGTDAWFRYVQFFEPCTMDLLDAMQPKPGTDPWLRHVQLFGIPGAETAQAEAA
ncbi:hypothetical protein [Arthrobacter sp. zg-Y1110]|uniref:hypothetical protein n=1 Tax=Arthrobacter sp. zg-Y1110 TaxID=2886932 RepID=UPI001D15DC98|nr:hypothetical protein [Arthrobacter sp. zg-Y1110]MCC3292485.1 hypothetical protein [Arthrobacter sp. zg-Y1110]UWX87083.1 hypothetical protein N2K99_17170 [Arthrobacter sp. zg-Y1110]